MRLDQEQLNLQLKLKVLADETRFRIICLLLRHDFCVGALARRLNISDAAVSQHLGLLRKVGMVKGEKRGYWTHYFVEREQLEMLGDELKRLARQNVEPPGLERSCDRQIEGELLEASGRRCAKHPDKKID